MGRKIIGWLISVAIFGIAALFGAASTAHAVPMTYNLQGVFDDGGTLRGSFIYDDSPPGSRSDIDIDTSATGSFPALHYSTALGYNPVPIGSTGLIGTLGISFLSDSVDSILVLIFDSPIWSGMSSPVVISSTSFEDFVPQPGVGQTRYIATGTTGIPEPTTVALMGLGLAGVGFARKKKRA